MKEKYKGSLPDSAYTEYALFHKKLLFNWVPGGVRKEMRLLDIGCHKGLLKDVLGGSIDYSGCNIETFDKGYIKQCDLNSDVLPYGGNFFDVVCATNVLEHLYNPEPICKEIQRVLKTDGHALISLPNDLGLSSLYSTISSCIFRKMYTFDEQKHEHHWKFSIKTAREFISRCFTIEKEAFHNGRYLQKINFIMKALYPLQSDLYMFVKQK